MNPSEYRTVSDPTTRRRIQAEVVDELRPDLARIASLVPAQYRDEAEQICAIGVLVALERYEPAQGSFPVVARREAVAEIKRWREHRSKLDAAFMAAICASDRELETRLDAFLGTLSEADRELLLREPRERQAGYEGLVQRGAVFVKSS